MMQRSHAALRAGPAALLASRSGRTRTGDMAGAAGCYQNGTPARRVSMPASKAISRVDTNARKLDEMIEEATVDCYDETEQASGLYTMIEENRTVPFKTRILGFGVSVVAIEMGDDGSPKAVSERGSERQLISVTDLPLPKP